MPFNIILSTFLFHRSCVLLFLFSYWLKLLFPFHLLATVEYFLNLGFLFCILYYSPDATFILLSAHRLHRFACLVLYLSKLFAVKRTHQHKGSVNNHIKGSAAKKISPCKSSEENLLSICATEKIHRGGSCVKEHSSLKISKVVPI